jgi:hypothetical protein
MPPVNKLRLENQGPERSNLPTRARSPRPSGSNVSCGGKASRRHFETKYFRSQKTESRGGYRSFGRPVATSTQRLFFAALPSFDVIDQKIKRRYRSRNDGWIGGPHVEPGSIVPHHRFHPGIHLGQSGNGWLTIARRHSPCSKRVRWPLKHPLPEFCFHMVPRFLAPKPIWLTASRLDLPVVSLRHR